MSKLIVGVDPGVRGCGVAWGTEERGIREAFYIKNFPASRKKGAVEPNGIQQMAYSIGTTITDAARGMGASELVVLVEWPQVYQGAQQKGDPNDLLMVAGVSSAILTAVEVLESTHRNPRDRHSIEYVRPRTWKGQVDPDVMLKLIEKQLSETEAFYVGVGMQSVPTSLRHNVWDAVGIVLHRLGRLGTKRIFRGDE